MQVAQHWLPREAVGFPCLEISRSRCGPTQPARGGPVWAGLGADGPRGPRCPFLSDFISTCSGQVKDGGMMGDIPVCWLSCLLLVQKFCLILLWTCWPPVAAGSRGRLPAVSINIYFSLSETNLLVWRVPQVLLLQDLVADSSVLAWSVALIEPTLWLRVPVDIFSRNLITSFV